MSICTVDGATYRKMLQDTFARYRRRGIPVGEAMQQARSLVDSAFRPDDLDMQWDLDMEADNQRVNAAELLRQSRQAGTA
jgi:hypothetical protein